MSNGAIWMAKSDSCVLMAMCKRLRKAIMWCGCDVIMFLIDCCAGWQDRKNPTLTNYKAIVVVGRM